MGSFSNLAIVICLLFGLVSASTTSYAPSRFMPFRLVASGRGYDFSEYLLEIREVGDGQMVVADTGPQASYSGARLAFYGQPKEQVIAPAGRKSTTSGLGFLQSSGHVPLLFGTDHAVTGWYFDYNNVLYLEMIPRVHFMVCNATINGLYVQNAVYVVHHPRPPIENCKDVDILRAGM